MSFSSVGKGEIERYFVQCAGNKIDLFKYEMWFYDASENVEYISLEIYRVFISL